MSDDLHALTQVTDELAFAVWHAVERVMEMQRRCIPESKTAVPYALYVQNSLPYWTNTPGEMPQPEGPADVTAFTITVAMRLVIDHVTSGYQGTNQKLVWLYLPAVLRYFRQYRDLIDQPGLAYVPYLAPKGCQITAPRGLSLFVTGETDATPKQLGLEFPLTVPLMLPARGVS